jgi:hydroxymethylpyrimidine pyrophosphatase-like HAD family hydrolase
MVLPASVDKASGLRAALDELGLSPENVVAIGDAENDQAFLATSGCGVAVANALDALKVGAARVTRGEAGAGVREVIDSLISERLQHDVPQ